MELPPDCRDTTPLTATVQHLYECDSRFFYKKINGLQKNAKNYQKYYRGVLKQGFPARKTLCD
ncbi:MAG: hypothetical protein ACYSW8_16340, partial [Planctomycetota bacterium]